MPIIPNVCDIYHGNPVNFTEIAANGIWGCVHKAHQGIGYGDPAYQGRQVAAKMVGLLWAAYDFSTGDNVADNVKTFLSYANLAPEDGACLDFEDNSVSEMTGDQAYEFLDRVCQARGTACWIYGGSRIRELIDQQDPDWIEMAKVAPLWQSRYIGLQPEDNSELFREINPIPPWTTNFMIQYTGNSEGPLPHTILGLQNGADLDVFNGTRDQLAAAWPGMAVTMAGPPSS